MDNSTKFAQIEKAVKAEETLKSQAKANQRRSKGQGVKGSSGGSKTHVDAEIARRLGVGKGTVYKVRKVLELYGKDSEFVKLVGNGVISISKAYVLAQDQIEFIKGLDEIRLDTSLSREERAKRNVDLLAKQMKKSEQRFGM